MARSLVDQVKPSMMSELDLVVMDQFYMIKLTLPMMSPMRVKFGI